MRSHCSSVSVDTAASGSTSRPSIRAAMLAMLRSRISGRSCTMPALFTSTSMRPCLATARVDRGGERRGVGDVERGRLAAHVGRDLRGRLGVEVVHDDVRAVSRESPADRRSQS